jgi:hypothetical protein
LQDETIKAALQAYRDQAAPSRAALAQELVQIAAGLQVAPAVVEPASDGSWASFFWRQVSRFYTIRPAGAELSSRLDAAAKSQDIQAAVMALTGQAVVPQAASAWLAKAQTWLAADAALSRLKAGAN